LQSFTSGIENTRPVICRILWQCKAERCQIVQRCQIVLWTGQLCLRGKKPYVSFFFLCPKKREDGLNVKQGILTIIGAVGAYIANLLGGWDAGLTTLVIFMAVDYFTGLIVAGIFHKSKKTESGALSSKAGIQGIAKKIMMLLMVLVAVRLDILTGTDYIRDAVIIALCGNELISIIENAGLMGVPIPKKLKDAIEVLSKKEEG